jgi:hypothetical protein
MPPLGKLRISYEVRENPKGTLEVLVGDEVVCHLPASEVNWNLKPGDVGVVTVKLIAQRADLGSIELGGVKATRTSKRMRHVSVGLCPGIHHDDFFMPDAQEGDRCPQCSCELFVYRRPFAERTRIVPLCDDCKDAES